jgi:hypothetical protein
MQPAFQISGDDLTMFYETLFCSNICLTMMHRANMEVISQKGFASIELWLHEFEFALYRQTGINE